MKICIDTPYVTVAEFVRRSGQSDSAIRKSVEQGIYLALPPPPGSKAVLINMVHLTMQAAEQAERARGGKAKAAGGE